MRDAQGKRKYVPPKKYRSQISEACGRNCCGMFHSCGALCKHLRS